ncbi:MAG: GerAB/ArcD/ProY family transporter [Thermoflavifilum sp.]|nr:GerAB/ArcD/ProY family transporter [Thermoflavifilum sp.]MCL6514404.1 GerAB/ArcD/ProY family transporter [Alicyclobacillus sp.]
MAKPSRITLSWFETITLGASSFIPLAFAFFPRIAVQYAGPDAFWALMITTCGGLAATVLIAALNDRFPNMTGADAACLLWGEVIARPILVLYTVAYVAFTGTSIYFFVLIIHDFLPKTPLPVLAASIGSVAFVGAWYGIECLGRVASLVHPLAWTGMGIICLYAVLQTPPFQVIYHPVSWKAMVNGAYHLMPLYFGLNFLQMISPFYKHSDTRWSFHYPIISFILGATAAIVTFYTTVGLLGPAPLPQLSFTLPFVLRLVTIHSLPIERVGIFVILFSTLFTVLFVSCHLWAISSLVARICKLTEDVASSMLPAVTVATLTVACCSFGTPVQAFIFLQKVLVPVSWVVLICVPAALYMTARVKA